MRAGRKPRLECDFGWAPPWPRKLADDGDRCKVLKPLGVLETIEFVIPDEFATDLYAVTFWYYRNAEIGVLKASQTAEQLQSGVKRRRPMSRYSQISTETAKRQSLRGQEPKVLDALFLLHLA